MALSTAQCQVIEREIRARRAVPWGLCGVCNRPEHRSHWVVLCYFTYMWNSSPRGDACPLCSLWMAPITEVHMRTCLEEYTKIAEELSSRFGLPKASDRPSLGSPANNIDRSSTHSNASMKTEANYVTMQPFNSTSGVPGSPSPEATFKEEPLDERETHREPSPSIPIIRRRFGPPRPPSPEVTLRTEPMDERSTRGEPSPSFPIIRGRFGPPRSPSPESIFKKEPLDERSTHGESSPSFPIIRGRFGPPRSPSPESIFKKEPLDERSARGTPTPSLPMSRRRFGAPRSPSPRRHGERKHRRHGSRSTQSDRWIGRPSVCSPPPTLCSPLSTGHSTRKSRSKRDRRQSVTPETLPIFSSSPGCSKFEKL